MLNKIYISVLSIFALSTLSAQRLLFDKPLPEYKSYKWDDTAKLHTLSPDEMKRNSVVIKDERIIEYYFVAHDTLAMFSTRHLIVRVNSDKAIAENNTVYISTANGIKIIDIQARAIGKDGKVTMLDPKNIKTVENYENLGPFTQFAIDGVEQGGEVEYIYTVRKPVNIFGTEYIRKNSLYKEINVDIYTPSHLVFLAKSYNGFPEVTLDSNMSAKRHIFARGHNIEGYEDEDFSAGDGALMRLEYTIAYNKNIDPDKRLYDYNDFCKWLFEENFDKKTDKEDLKIAAKVIDTMKLNRYANEEDKIRYIESRIKTSIQVREDLDDDNVLKLPFIFKNRVTNSTGIMKLYHLLFNAAGIKHEIVKTSNRFDKPFDGDFESQTYMQNYLIYFPGIPSQGITYLPYIAPAEIASRYGFPPADWLCQKGFFMHELTIEKLHTGVGKAGDLPCNDYKQSMSDIYADVKFDFDMGTVNIHYKQTYTGYEAYSIQPFYSFLADQDRKDFADKLFQSFFEDAKPENVKVSGYNENDIFRNPFVVEADISTGSAIEKTGNKYLFKIGLLIGPQSQLYNDTVRHTPIENHNNRGYHREISFVIPDGYAVTNLNALNMDVYDSTSEQKKTMEFHSWYKADGNKVTVYCDEYYSQIRYPISMYQQFRSVINASADFNKIVLFMEKK